MRRAIAGPRAARIRPMGAVRVAAMAGAVLLAAGCGAMDAGSAAPVADVETVAPTTSAVPTTPPPTTPPPTTSAAPQPVAVPDVVGLSVARARAALSGAGLRWRTALRRTAAAAPGTVLAQSPGGERAGEPGSVVTLTVAQALPKPKPTPRPTPKPAPAPEPEPATPDCHPSYAGACLDPDASDYDCCGGSGNGPEYTGRVTVVGPDVFDLDRDSDGIGCERD